MSILVLKYSYSSSPFSFILLRWTQLIRSAFPHRPCSINLSSILVFPPPACKKHPCTPLPTPGQRAWPWPHWCPGIISFYIQRLIFLWREILIKNAFPSSLLPNSTADADSICDLCNSVTQLFVVHFFFLLKYYIAFALMGFHLADIMHFLQFIKIIFHFKPITRDAHSPSQPHTIWISTTFPFYHLSH